MKKALNALSIVVIAISFSCVSFININNGNSTAYASHKHHKINSDDETFWQKIYDGLKDVQN